jgi:hypothetical protein
VSIPDAKIDAEEALALLERAVAEKGENYIDPNSETTGCIYFDYQSHQPCCIVGHLLHYKGVGYDDLGHSLNMDGPVVGVNEHISIFTDLAQLILVSAQLAQDRGDTWGEALEKARLSLEETAGVSADV